VDKSSVFTELQSEFRELNCTSMGRIRKLLTCTSSSEHRSKAFLCSNLPASYVSSCPKQIFLSCSSTDAQARSEKESSTEKDRKFHSLMFVPKKKIGIDEDRKFHSLLYVERCSISKREEAFKREGRDISFPNVGTMRST